MLSARININALNTGIACGCKTAVAIERIEPIESSAVQIKRGNLLKSYNVCAAAEKILKNVLVSVVIFIVRFLVQIPDDILILNISYVIAEEINISRDY